MSFMAWLAGPAVSRSAQPPSSPTLSADLTVTGRVSSSRGLQLEGRVEGDVRANKVVLGNGAILVGDIYADEAIIRGHVEGTIRAGSVQLTQTAHVRGDILHTHRLAIDTGADFAGRAYHIPLLPRDSQA